MARFSRLDHCDDALLRIEDLTTSFQLDGRSVCVVDGIDLELARGEALGLVGESGSGKSVTALSILRLVPDPPGRIVKGKVVFKGRDLLRLTAAEMRKVRGNDIAIAFQEPKTALNPLMTVGEQVAEAAIQHRSCRRGEARRLAGEILAEMGIPEPRKILENYPHQLSGGMCQRVLIAIALICLPELLIADEVTSSLDVTIQAQILDLLDRLRAERHMSLLLISHDFGVIAEICDQVAVMYAGSIVESAGASSLFAHPRHPYTAALFRSRPSPGEVVTKLRTIRGSMPRPDELPTGCRFHPRCPRVREECRQQRPALVEIGSGHRVACFYPH